MEIVILKFCIVAFNIVFNATLKLTKSVKLFLLLSAFRHGSAHVPDKLTLTEPP
jgi:hypothetical protein